MEDEVDDFSADDEEGEDSFDDDFGLDEEGEDEAVDESDGADFDVEAYIKWRQENPDQEEMPDTLKKSSKSKNQKDDDSDAYGDEE